MDQEFNPGRLFLEAAVKHPEKIALKLPRSELSYDQVRSLVLAFALRFRDLGVNRSSCVALDTIHFSVAAASYFAVALLGARFVQATKNALAEPRLGITHVFHDGTNPYPMQPGIYRIEPSWSSHAALDLNRPVTFDGYASENDTWFFSQSSGTTGTSKIMGLSYRNAVGRLLSNSIVQAGRDLTVAVSFNALAPGGINSFSGLSIHSGTIVVGGDYAFLQTAGVKLVIGTPVQHAKRLAGMPPPAGAKIPMARVGGAKALPEFLKMMFQYFDRVTLSYGSTEAGPVCRRVITPEDTDVDELGPANKGASIEIVDPDDRQVPPGTEGIVRLRTTFLVSSYVSGGEDNRNAFRNGWFYPGDLGQLSASGNLRITGRVNDQLSIGGIKVNSLVVDRVLEQVPEVTDGIAFVEPGAGHVPELAVVVSLREGAKPEAVADAIRNLCRTAISRAIVPARVYVTDKVPRNPNGKATRHAAAELAKGWPKY